MQPGASALLKLLQSKPNGFASSLAEGALGKTGNFPVLPRASSMRRLSPKVTGGVWPDAVFLSGPFREKADQPGPQAWLICNIKKISADIFGLRLPASASCLGRHSHLAGRGPNSSFLFLPLAAVVAVAERMRRPF